MDKCLFETNKVKSFTSHLRYKHFISSKCYYDIYLKREKEGVCINCCIKHTKFISITKGYLAHCSIKCSNNSEDKKIKIQKFFIKKYGKGITNASHLQATKDKISKSNSNKEVIDRALKKRKQTNIKKYGIDILLRSKKIKENIEKTNILKYGGHPLKCKAIRNKIEKTNFNKNLQKSFKLLKHLNLKLVSNCTDWRNDVKILCCNCNSMFITKLIYIKQGYGLCPNCTIRVRSKEQNNLSYYISKLNLIFKKNTKKIIFPLELDIYIPDKEIAIEYNGLYWHSEKKLIDKNYHLNKLNLCNDKDIQLIQIFEDEWLFKQDIVKSRLKQILGVSTAKKIYARQCKIKEVLPKIKNEFLNTYHIQGKDNSSVKLGAYYNEELVAIMTFAKGNIAKGSKAKEGVWELNRYCSNSNYRVVGIAGKLLKHFQRNYEWKSIFSYADRRWSQGNLYKVLGFKLDSITKPNYWYTKGNLGRIHRFSLRKRPEEPKNIPEWALRIKEGYNRIWDCGNLKFLMEV